jgi:hypothetical protein
MTQKTRHSLKVPTLTKALVPVLLTLFAFVSSAFGQAGNFQSIAISAAGRPISGGLVAVCQGATTTAASLTSNIATLTMASNPITAGFTLGSTILVASFSGADAYFNGLFVITSLSTSQIQYADTHANGSATSNGNVVQQGATSSTACLPLATTYTDQTASNVAANPSTTDSIGNVNFWAIPGVYAVQYYGQGVTTRLITSVVTCVPGGTNCGAPLSANNTFTGTNTFSGNTVISGGQNNIVAFGLNGVVLIDNNKYACSATGINSAILTLSATGGLVDARGCVGGITGQTSTLNVGSNSPSQYGVALLMPNATYSGSADPLIFVNLRSALFTQPGTIIQQTTNAGHGVVIAGNNGGAPIVGGIFGQGAIVGTGEGTSTGIGLFLGGDPANPAYNPSSNSGNYLEIGPITVSGFLTGEEIGNNVFIIKHDHTQIFKNTHLLLQPSTVTGSGEGITWDTASFAENTGAYGDITISAPSELKFIHCSFDGVNVVINASLGVRATFLEGHFELVLGATNSDFITTSGSSSHVVTIVGGEFVEDTVSTRTEFITNGSGTLRIYGLSVFPQETVGALVAMTGTAGAEIYGLGATNLSAIFSGAGTGPRMFLTTSTPGVGDAELNLGATSTLTAAKLVTGVGAALILSTAPTVTSGFNTGSIGGSNGPASFFVTVGAGGAVSTGVVGLPAASNGWNCSAQNQTRADLIQQTSNSATSATFTNFGTTFAATNWTNGDSILISCFAR